MAEITLIKKNKPALSLGGAVLTPESICSTLMRAKVEFHFFHIQTKSFAKHNALDTLYSEITDLLDDIVECILGRLGIRLNGIKIESIENYSDEKVNSCLNELAIFSDKLFDWSNEKKYWDINNLAAELIQLINKSRYRLSLS